MSDAWEYGNEEDMDDDGNDWMFYPTRHTILLIDTTLPTSASEQDKSNLQELLITIRSTFTTLSRVGLLRKSHVSVVALTDSVHQLVDFKSTDITSLERFVDNFSSNTASEKLSLHEGIEFSVETLSKFNKKDIRRIVLITANPQPTFKDENGVLEAGRMIRMNFLEFVLLPLVTEIYNTFVASKFYQLFFEQLDETKTELVYPESTIISTLCNQIQPRDLTTKVHFYLTQNDSFEMIEEKLFRLKEGTGERVVERKDGEQPPVNDVFKSETQDEDVGVIREPTDDGSGEVKMAYTLNEKVVIKFTPSQLKEIDELCYQPRKNGLYLLQIDDEMKHPIPNVDDVRSILIKSNNYLPHRKLFNTIWKYCVSKKKVLYCLLLNKKRNTVVLRPTVFNNQPYFIRYGLTYINNLSPVACRIPIDENPLDEWELQKWENIIDHLKNTNKTFLDLPDSKRVQLEALAAAKVEKRPFIQPEDQLTKEYHRVGEILVAVKEEFENNW